MRLKALPSDPLAVHSVNSAQEFTRNPRSVTGKLGREPSGRVGSEKLGKTADIW